MRFIMVAKAALASARCQIVFILNFQAVIVCLLDIPVFILLTVMFLRALEIPSPRPDGSYLLSFLLLSVLLSLVQTTKPKNLATRCEIGAVVESKIIPPLALQAEAQSFKQLQA